MRGLTIWFALAVLAPLMITLYELSLFTETTAIVLGYVSALYLMVSVIAGRKDTPTNSELDERLSLARDIACVTKTVEPPPTVWLRESRQRHCYYRAITHRIYWPSTGMRNMAHADFIRYTFAAREVSKNRTKILRTFAKDFMATFAIVLVGPIVYWLASATTNGLILLSTLVPGFGIGFMLAQRHRAGLNNQIDQLSRDPIARLVWCQEVAWDAYRPAVDTNHRTDESQLPIAQSPEERADVA